MIACEPDPDNLEVLRANLVANDLAPHVDVRRLALGRRSGTGSLERRPRRYLNAVRESGAAPADPADGAGHGEPVELESLVGMLERAGVREVDVLKVNTAGHEADVLEGALPAFVDRRIGLAMLLDGVAVRAAVERATRSGALAHYAVAAYDGTGGRIVRVPDVAALGSRPLSPMNHYLLLERQDDDPHRRAGPEPGPAVGTPAPSRE